MGGCTIEWSGKREERLEKSRNNTVSKIFGTLKINLSEFKQLLNLSEFLYK